VSFDHCGDALSKKEIKEMLSALQTVRKKKGLAIRRTVYWTNCCRWWSYQKLQTRKAITICVG